MTPPASRDARRARLVALLVLGVAAVLLLSSVSWFGSGRPGVGIGQLALAVVVGGVGALLARRSGRAG